ncbi:MAG: DNA mismatch repair protein MutS [Bacteroidetes bacterium]|nr:DNA mismatch repair protein MutS [Bacteroidota bacterium]
MHNDKITLRDLSIFSTQGEDLFSLVDKTTSSMGREALRHCFRNPPDDFDRLQATQEVLRWWSKHPEHWTRLITNGTLVLLEKFFEAADSVHAPSGLSLLFGNFFQKLINRNQYSFIQFSLSQLADFLKGCKELTALLELPSTLPSLLETELKQMQDELNHPLIPLLIRVDKHTPYATLSRLSFRARRELKHRIYQLMEHYARLDAEQAMGQAGRDLGWQYPELRSSLPLQFQAKGLYHPLLETPVPYDLEFHNGQHFLFLTGANMSGKTTFMRALGVSTLLAHMGMAVPAQSMTLSFLEGIITNMHVEDNLLRGESYFFAEVQRMKNTAQKVAGQGPHLLLMDELFKGTNVHDAYECTRAVVEGLLLHPDQLMVLSTHIHEVAQHFEKRSEIVFSYFVTDTQADGRFQFRYELRQGISNDRIGYRILLQEGVLDILNCHNLGNN